MKRSVRIGAPCKDADAISVPEVCLESKGT